MSATCPHADAGCNFPESECSGHCLVESGLRKRQDPPGYLTIVYRITHPGQPRALLEQAEWSAASHTHAIHERDQLQAENKLLKATQYGSGRLQELRDVRDKLQARLDAANQACNEMAIELEKVRRERDHWYARLLAEVGKRNKSIN